jgi:multicomponent Na+:H+ antiporter subunit G
VREVVVDVLLVAGVAVTVAASLAMLLVRRASDRIHLLAPTTSLGAPLVGAALVVENGLTLTSGQIGLVVVLLAVTGPVVASATGRARVERHRAGVEEDPE